MKIELIEPIDVPKSYLMIESLNRLKGQNSAVSISFGDPKQNFGAKYSFNSKEIKLFRIAVSDKKEAIDFYEYLDGKVGAFSIDGCDLGTTIDNRFYPFYSVTEMFEEIETPYFDGSTLKATLEPLAARILKGLIEDRPKTCFVLVGYKRWELVSQLEFQGFELKFGDLAFSTGLPIIIDKLTLEKLVPIVFPIIGLLPFEWLYPTSDKQYKRQPKCQEEFEWASVIAGDSKYIATHMPERLDGKIIITNAVTEKDREMFCEAGVEILITTAPLLIDCNPDTNLFDAALNIYIGKGNDWTEKDIYSALSELEIEPEVYHLQSVST